ncbi:MAG: DUF502 domain-containing protein [Candidatus Eisenbacteria bacterium]
MIAIGRLLRHKFLAGILVVVPVGVTYMVLKLLFGAVDNILAPIIERFLGLHIPGLGVATTIFLVFLIGLIATNVFGKTILNYVDRGLSRIPFVGTVYVSAKQVTDALGKSSAASFKRVVFVEYPRKGLLVLGFVTRERLMVTDKDGHTTEVVNVFLPTTPNPTSGFFVATKPSELIRVDLTVEQGIKLVMSGGILAPPEPLMMDETAAVEEHPSPPCRG